MRGLKFRAWTNVGSFKEPKDGMVYAHLDQLYGGELGDGTHFVDGHALMQFTGLKDKNGTEIYEGDIVRARLMQGDNHTYTHPVKFVTHPAPMFAINGRQMNDDGYEVIGNIYENPELLDQ